MFLAPALGGVALRTNALPASTAARFFSRAHRWKGWKHRQRPGGLASQYTLETLQQRLNERLPRCGKPYKPRYYVSEVEQRELERIKKAREESGEPFDHFMPGDHLAVKMKTVSVDSPRGKIVTGVVLGKTNKGLRSMFRLRCLVYGTFVEYNLPLYSPWIFGMLVTKKIRYRQNKPLHLREFGAPHYQVQCPDWFRAGLPWDKWA